MFSASIVKMIFVGVLALTQVQAFDAPTGLAVRIQQKTVDQLKHALQPFLPHFLTYDMKLAKTEEYDFKLLFGLLKYHFIWENITYEQPTMDLLDTNIIFE